MTSKEAARRAEETKAAVSAAKEKVTSMTSAEVLKWRDELQEELNAAHRVIGVDTLKHYFYEVQAVVIAAAGRGK